MGDSDSLDAKGGPNALLIIRLKLTMKKLIDSGIHPKSHLALKENPPLLYNS